MAITFRLTRTALLVTACALPVAGCHRTASGPDDSLLTLQVQGRLAADQNLTGQTVQASVAGGTVTLSGSVTSDKARTIASGDAAQVAGVRAVVNNLTIQPAASAPASATVETPAPAPIRTEHPDHPGRTDHIDQADRTNRSDHTDMHDRSRGAGPDIARNAPPPSIQQQPPMQPAPIVRNAPASPMAAQQPMPPPQPVVRTITLPAGTTLPVRITQTLDSETTQQGDRFSGAIASDVLSDGIVVLPQGTPVTGHVDAVQDATHFKGSSLLTISLSAITRKGERIDIATEPYTKEGQGRGKNTAEKVGGGAALGAILGGIFGGGKGAAIGTVAGGGLGAGAQAATRGQQVQIPSETIVRFKLTSSPTIHVTPGGQDTPEPSPVLQRRNQ